MQDGGQIGTEPDRQSSRRGDSVAPFKLLPRRVADGEHRRSQTRGLAPAPEDKNGQAHDHVRLELALLQDRVGHDSCLDDHLSALAGQLRNRPASDGSGPKARDAERTGADDRSQRHGAPRTSAPCHTGGVSRWPPNESLSAPARRGQEQEEP